MTEKMIEKNKPDLFFVEMGDNSAIGANFDFNFFEKWLNNNFETKMKKFNMENIKEYLINGENKKLMCLTNLWGNDQLYMPHVLREEHRKLIDKKNIDDSVFFSFDKGIFHNFQFSIFGSNNGNRKTREIILDIENLYISKNIFTPEIFKVSVNYVSREGEENWKTFNMKKEGNRFKIKIPLSKSITCFGYLSPGKTSSLLQNLKKGNLFNDFSPYTYPERIFLGRFFSGKPYVIKPMWFEEPIFGFIIFLFNIFGVMLIMFDVILDWKVNSK